LRKKKGGGARRNQGGKVEKTPGHILVFFFAGVAGEHFEVIFL